MASIAEQLRWAKPLMTVGDTPALDAEILLAHVLQADRSYLIAFPERQLTLEEEKAYSALVAKRQQGTPIAYLTGHKEFWSLDLVVTPDTLIPRPETELLVELVLNRVTGSQKMIADLGTGSGAIALAIAKEHPDWIIYAIDQSVAALEIAKLNAKRLNVTNILFQQGVWCQTLPPLCFDAIVSNPPYIARDDVHLSQGELHYEPYQALVAEDNGLQCLRDIIVAARNHLKSAGYLMLEHGYQQAQDVGRFFTEMRYTNIDLYKDFSGQDRVTCGRYMT